MTEGTGVKYPLQAGTADIYIYDSAILRSASVRTLGGRVRIIYSCIITRVIR